MVPANAETLTLKLTDSPAPRTSVGNSDGSVEGIVALKQISIRPISSSPRKIETPVWCRISRIIGNASTTRPTDPTQAIGLRPTRSESMPSSGISTSATAITTIWRYCEVVDDTEDPPCIFGMVSVT